MSRKEPKTTINTERKDRYIDFIVIPLKIVACWDLFPNTNNELRLMINNFYLGLVLFTLTYIPVSLSLYLYMEWKDIMSSLDKIADSLPLLVSLVIVGYCALYRRDMYQLVEYMEKNFKYHSARGLTNMTMYESCKASRQFGRIYTACCMFSVTMYTTLPLFAHLWTDEPIKIWILDDISRSPFYEVMFVVSFVAQIFVGLAMGQFGVFFASNSILICGQLDLLCCSLRNTRYTAMLQNGVKHSALVRAYSDIREDEKHNFIYNYSEMEDSNYHYDKKVPKASVVKTRFAERPTLGNGLLQRFLQLPILGRSWLSTIGYYVCTLLDIYSAEYDTATMEALHECAAVCQVVARYKQMFERFVSPLLVLRVVQVTMYLCTLLYAATLKFEMVTVEYLAAVALDIFVYCYYGNQIIIQADRVSTAAYQSAWHTVGGRPRRVLLNILLANKRPVIVRAGRFLPMDLHTFVLILKTSFSYYTLLVNVNEEK